MIKLEQKMTNSKINNERHKVRSLRIHNSKNNNDQRAKKDKRFCVIQQPTGRQHVTYYYY